MRKISGTVETNGKTVSIHGHSGLKVGQLVQVYVPTNEAVRHYRTGKIMGYKESVLGRGNVEDMNGTLVVKITQEKNDGSFASIASSSGNVIIKALE